MNTQNKLKPLQLHLFGQPSEFEPPYLVSQEINIIQAYNPDFGDDRICVCGHSYYRHFDSYEDMLAVGCKYCECYTFSEKLIQDTHPP